MLRTRIDVHIGVVTRVVASRDTNTVLGGRDCTEIAISLPDGQELGLKVIDLLQIALNEIANRLRRPSLVALQGGMSAEALTGRGDE